MSSKNKHFNSSDKKQKMKEEDIQKEEISKETAKKDNSIQNEEEVSSTAKEEITTEELSLNQEENLNDELKQTQEELADYKDKYLRLAAEFDNYRKRTMKEKTELILNGSEKAINSILPVLDDLERAVSNLGKTEDAKTIEEGIKLIYSKFVQTLEQNGLKEIESIGKELDTDFHEAIALVPTQDEKQKGKIIDCTQKGYILNDKVIRHAKVVIGQ